MQVAIPVLDVKKARDKNKIKKQDER